MNVEMINSKPVSIPMEMLDKVLVIDFKPVTHYPYREIIGKLSYLANNTIPDLSFSVSVLRRFCNSYGEFTGKQLSGYCAIKWNERYWMKFIPEKGQSNWTC